MDSVQPPWQQLALKECMCSLCNDPLRSSTLVLVMTCLIKFAFAPVTMTMITSNIYLLNRHKSNLSKGKSSRAVLIRSDHTQLGGARRIAASGGGGDMDHDWLGFLPHSNRIRHLHLILYIWIVAVVAVRRYRNANRLLGTMDCADTKREFVSLASGVRQRPRRAVQQRWWG